MTENQTVSELYSFGILSRLGFYARCEHALMRVRPVGPQRGQRREPNNVMQRKGRRAMPKKQTDKPQRRTQVKDQPKKEKALSKGELKQVRGGVNKVEALTIKQKVTE
jgi:hypothetical protein